MSPAFAVLAAAPHGSSPLLAAPHDSPPALLIPPTSPADDFKLGEFVNEMAHMQQNVAYFEEMFEMLTRSPAKAPSPLREQHQSLKGQHELMVQQIQQEVTRLAPVRSALKLHLEAEASDLQQCVTRIRVQLNQIEQNNGDLFDRRLKRFNEELDVLELSVLDDSRGSMMVAAASRLKLKISQWGTSWDDWKLCWWLVASFVASFGFVSLLVSVLLNQSMVLN